MTVDKKKYEIEMLYSLLNDASNILIRESIRPAGLVLIEKERLGWSDQLLQQYLPVFAEEVPLTDDAVTLNQAEGQYWVRLPRTLVQEALQKFLGWFLERATDQGAIHADAKTRFKSELGKVADEVAKGANRPGFAFGIEDSEGGG